MYRRSKWYCACRRRTKIYINESSQCKIMACFCEPQVVKDAALRPHAVSERCHTVRRWMKTDSASLRVLWADWRLWGRTWVPPRFRIQSKTELQLQETSPRWTVFSPHTAALCWWRWCPTASLTQLGLQLNQWANKWGESQQLERWVSTLHELGLFPPARDPLCTLCLVDEWAAEVTSAGLKGVEGSIKKTSHCLKQQIRKMFSCL